MMQTKNKILCFIQPHPRVRLFFHSRGQNTEILDAANGTSTATYDTLGNVTRLAGPLGGATNYTYDNMGRLTSESTVSGGTKAYEYNELNIIKKITNARGQIRQIFYDAKGKRPITFLPKNILKTFSNPIDKSYFT